jgi:hypothetical protein
LTTTFHPVIPWLAIFYPLRRSKNFLAIEEIGRRMLGWGRGDVWERVGVRQGLERLVKGQERLGSLLVALQFREKETFIEILLC